LFPTPSALFSHTSQLTARHTKLFLSFRGLIPRRLACTPLPARDRGAKGNWGRGGGGGGPAQDQDRHLQGEEAGQQNGNYRPQP
jgi:hypothetical protein